MQLVAEISGQSICENVLASDSRIMYSGYIRSDGARVGEAMKKCIIDYERLTVMVLPLPPNSDVLVLAAPPSSDLHGILSSAKQAIA